MRGLSRKLTTLVSVHFANALAYRAELFIWALSGTLPLILAGIWTELAESGALGMSPAEYAQYFLCTFIVRQLTLVWVVWEFENDVITGRLSHHLLQDLNPGWRYFAQHVAERVPRLPVLAMLGALFWLLYPEELAQWRLSTQALGLAAVAICLTFIMRFCVQYAFAMLAFWTERAHAIEQLWYLPYLFLSGLLIPLDDVPEGLRAALMYTPFPYLIYFPSKILLGQIGPAQAMQGFAITIGWAAVFYGIYRAMWRAGLSRFSAMGA